MEMHQESISLRTGNSPEPLSDITLPLPPRHPYPQPDVGTMPS